MKRRVQIYDNGTAYIGRQIAADGFIGDADALFNAVTITIIKPNTSLDAVKRSLEITLQDVELRIQEDNKRVNNAKTT